MSIDPKTLPVLKPGSRGPAVKAAKMGVHAWNAKAGNTTALYGPFFRPLVKAFQAAHKLTADGVIGPSTWKALFPHLNAEARKLLEPKPVPPPPVASLHPSLWAAYHDALTTPGLFSLGTYNPDSRLPSGKRSDHAVWPAMAFDIGFDPDTGWAHPKARAYAEKTIKRAEVEYVILGNRINTKDERGWRPYTSGGHLNHVHVSGRR